MELVDDHDVELTRIQSVQPGSVEALNRSEDVLEESRPLAPDPELAEGVISQCLSESRHGLCEDLFPMGDEQEAGSRQLLAETCVVERRHHSLAGAGGGNEKVPMVSAAPGQCDLLEEAFLEELWSELDGAQRELKRSAAFGLRASEELLAVVRNEVATVPV